MKSNCASTPEQSRLLLLSALYCSKCSCFFYITLSYLIKYTTRIFVITSLYGIWLEDQIKETRLCFCCYHLLRILRQGG